MLKRTKAIKSVLTFLIFTAVVMIAVPSVFAARDAEKTVRVGYYTGDSGFQSGLSDNSRKSGYAYEYYQALSSLTGWSYEYVYGSRAEIMDLIVAGDVDIVAGVYKTDKRIGQMLFSENDMGLNGEKRYFAVSLRRPDLLEELNLAQAKIMEQSPDFAVELRQKYYSQESQNKPLTEQEKAWLLEKGALRMGYIRKNLPLSEQAEDGKPSGVIKEISSVISSYLKIPFEFVCYDNISMMEEALVNDEIDAAFPIYHDIWAAENTGYFLTDYFVSDKVMLVFKGNYRSGLLDRVAISDTSVGQIHYLENYYPNAETIHYNTRKECLSAILNGEADSLIGCASVLQRFLTENAEYQDLHIAYLEIPENFGFAVNRNENILIGILNKAIGEIDGVTVTNALIQYSGADFTYDFTDFLRRYSTIVISVLCVFFAVLMWMFINFRRRTNLFNKEQAKTRAALEDALSAANAASEAKTTFLSSMSHDIRTPMNGIIGMTAIATAHIDNRERVKDCLSKINASGKHLLSLINEVLDMSKIESGEFSLSENELSLPKLIYELVTLNKPLSDEKHHEMLVHTAISHEKVLGDTLRIQQIFTNLVSNAIKYTPDNGKIRISLTEKPSGKQNLGCFEFVVEDNGIGMSEDYLPHIFEAFSRVDNSSTNKTQGSGLGLAIARNITLMMDGDIKVESALGKGSKFTVTLFLKLPDSDLPENKIPEEHDFLLADGSEANDNLGELLGNEPEAYESELQYLAEQTDFSGKRALLAEDNDINAEIAIEILTMTGLSVEWARNGKEAADMFDASKPGYYDCIFMDIQMPVMNGIEAVKTIRASAHADAKKIPVFAITANAFADDVHAVLDAGMNEHISKPLDFNILIKVLNAYLSKED